MHLTALPALAVLAAVTGCGHTRQVAPSEPLAKNGLPIPHWNGIVPGYLTIHIMEGRVPRLGMVLVDGSGHTLYAFLSDKKRSVTCVGTCTAVWRPITLRAEQALDSNPSLDDKLLGGDPGPNGRRVVTFGGWPLYTYTGDTQAGTATGQNTYSYGGRWSAILPSGALAAGTFVHLAR